MDFGNKRIQFCRRVMTVVCPGQEVPAHLTLLVFRDKIEIVKSQEWFWASLPGEF